MEYHYPTNKEEYWNVVNSHWDNLYSILVRFLSIEEIEDANDCRKNRNPEMASLFNEAWANAPDERSIHSIPDWHILCDLCSESYVLYESEENNV